MTFAGRTVALNGAIQGAQAKEWVQGGIVSVEASETVLILFDAWK